MPHGQEGPGLVDDPYDFAFLDVRINMCDGT